MTNRIFNVGTALDRSSTKLIYSAAWASIVAHEIGHILGMAGDEYSGEIQEYMFDYAFNMARSDSEARQRWGHWIGYKDPISGYEIKEPYIRDGTNYFVPTQSNGLMNNSGSGDFHAVNREQMILELYKRVSPIDSYTENNQTIGSGATLELNVVDEDVISRAWVVNSKIISREKNLDLSKFDLDNGAVIYGCAWDKTLNSDYASNDRGGWVRVDKSQSLTQIVSWKVSDVAGEHLDGNNSHLISFLLTNTFEENFFNTEEVIMFKGGDEKKYEWYTSGTEEEGEEGGEKLGWFDSGFWGAFYVSGNGWIYHIKYGWMYLSGSWSWMESRRGWLWTQENYFPYFYSNNLQEWIYLN